MNVICTIKYIYYNDVNTTIVDISKVENERCTTVTSTCTDEADIRFESLTE